MLKVAGAVAFIFAPVQAVITSHACANCELSFGPLIHAADMCGKAGKVAADLASIHLLNKNLK